MSDLVSKYFNLNEIEQADLCKRVEDRLEPISDQLGDILDQLTRRRSNIPDTPHKTAVKKAAGTMFSIIAVLPLGQYLLDGYLSRENIFASTLFGLIGAGSLNSARRKSLERHMETVGPLEERAEAVQNALEEYVDDPYLLENTMEKIIWLTIQLDSDYDGSKGRARRELVKDYIDGIIDDLDLFERVFRKSFIAGFDESETSATLHIRRRMVLESLAQFEEMINALAKREARLFSFNASKSHNHQVAVENEKYQTLKEIAIHLRPAIRGVFNHCTNLQNGILLNPAEFGESLGLSLSAEISL